MLLQAPHLALPVVGSGVDTPKRARMLSTYGARLAGLIHYLAVKYGRASWVLLSTWNDGGTGVTILTCLAIGQACVVAALLTRDDDFHLYDGRQLVVARDKGVFSVIALATYGVLGQRLEDAGRTAVRRHFSGDMLVGRIQTASGWR